MALISLQITAALLLDILLGDPRRLPHPVRLLGNLGAFLERFYRKTEINLGLAGVLTLAAMIGAGWFTTFLILEVAAFVAPFLHILASIIIFYTTFCIRDLLLHAREVLLALEAGDLELARQKTGMIVGRDTNSLSESEIIRATVESVAESLVDGITAPLFYGFLAGPAGSMVYKAINTADSMFGYKNEYFREFGWAAARLDDLVNFIPARLTALFIPPAAFIVGLDHVHSWRIMLRDRKKHTSPNSGHTEAAAAGALNIQLGGSSLYFGELITKPALGEAWQELRPGHIREMNRLMLTTAGLVFLIFFPLGL
ncbi:MAG: adenosylcobinamide-phosphate synthase CbiB [Thermodesulfobacteriota bacterium]